MERDDAVSGNWLSNLERDGFAVIPDVVGESKVAELIHAMETARADIPAMQRCGRSSYAMRNLLESVPAVRALARSRNVQAITERVLGSDAFPVRGLLFDKIPGANWKVAWHQDLSIAVRRQKEVASFGPWSVKAGVPHVQPPASILERMLTLRLHLDDCGEDNGPLRVIPGSHLAGRLSADEIDARRGKSLIVACTVKRGAALLMRPLLLHASSAARVPHHRRVIHLEFASGILPGGLEWQV